MRFIAIIAAVALSGCDVYKHEIDFALKACGPHGGVDHIHADFGVAHCDDGTKITPPRK